MSRSHLRLALCHWQPQTLLHGAQKCKSVWLVLHRNPSDLIPSLPQLSQCPGENLVGLGEAHSKIFDAPHHTSLSIDPLAPLSTL
jgi:hypothetical protein